MTERDSQRAPLPTGDASSYDQYPAQSNVGSLPLLVKMPNGERHQVDVAPTASVKDLKASIANQSSTWGLTDGEQDQNWDLDFGGSTLNDNKPLSAYNIPDVYGHTSTLLKTISDSGYGNPGKKVEALTKAYEVVNRISRGEKDMERLVNAILDEENDPVPESPSAQPSLDALRKSRRSRIPPLNFDTLPAPGLLPVTSKGKDKAANPSAPPTPSQLIRKLSGMRPDLYDPSSVKRATASLEQSGSKLSRLGLPRSSGAGGTALPVGSGELRRGNTWFTDYITSALDPSQQGYSGEGSSEDEDKDSDVDGDSEDPGDEDSTAKPLIGSNFQVNSQASLKATRENSSTSNPKSKQEAGEQDTRTLQTEDSKKDESDEQKSQVTGSTNGNPTQGTVGPFSMEERTGSSVVPGKQVIGLGPDAASTGDIKQRKKRGRKRKDPHLTDEERKAKRQAQNRESAKLSRIKRKNQTMEYEKRVNTLEGENENLRGTVAALTDRLEMLQGLLTISVRPMQHLPPSNQDGMPGLPQLNSQALNVQPPFTGQGALAAPGALHSHTQSGSQAHYQANPLSVPHPQLIPPSQGPSGVSGRRETAAPTSNPLGNLGFKNY